MKTLKNITGILLVLSAAVVCFGLLQVWELMP